MFKIVRTVSSLPIDSSSLFRWNGVSRRQCSNFCDRNLSATKTLKGTVNDAFGPLVGVSVVVKGTTNGVVTDLDGNFTLNVNEGDILQISL